MDVPERLAAIDVGSNAVRLVVGRLFLDGTTPSIRREASYRVPLRLGEDVFTHGSISTAAAEQLEHIFHSFRHLLNFFAPRAVRACATSAMREASNGLEIAQHIGSHCQIPLEVISGSEEAALLFRNYLEPDSGFDHNKNYLYIDVGGGSTELTLMVLGKALVSESFRIGTVRLLKDRVEPQEWNRMRDWIYALPKHLDPTEAIGCGGNIGKIFDLLEHQSARQSLARKHIRPLIESMATLTVPERMKLYGLKPDRADVIVPAGRIFLQVLHWAAIKTILVPKVGVADGILKSLEESLARN